MNQKKATGAELLLVWLAVPIVSLLMLGGIVKVLLAVFELIEGVLS